MVWDTQAYHEHQRAAAARGSWAGSLTHFCVYAADSTYGFHQSVALQIKRTTFQRPPEEKIFGVPRPLDPEGAREGVAGTPHCVCVT